MNSNGMFRIITFILILVCLVFTGDVWGGNLTSSSYEINLSISYPREIVAEAIHLERIKSTEGSGEKQTEIYLPEFNLRSKNNKINPTAIVVETPYYQGSADSNQEILLLREGQTSSWFKIGLLPEALFNKPGLYRGNISLPGLEWEIIITAEIEPYTSLRLESKKPEREVHNPSNDSYFIAEEFCQLEIVSNHRKWKLWAEMEQDLQTEDSSRKIPAERVFLSAGDSGTIFDSRNRIITELFFRDQRRLIVTGKDYRNRVLNLNWGFEQGRDWTAQPAGHYNGKILLTIENADL
ncbi:MAG: hypothetical protein ACOCQH_02410 [Halanaerobiales bacterium]